MFKIIVVLLIAPIALAQQPHHLGKYVAPHVTPVNLGTAQKVPPAPLPQIVKIADTTHIVRH